MNAAEHPEEVSAPMASVHNDEHEGEDARGLPEMWDDVRSWAQALAHTYQRRPGRSAQGDIQRV